MPQVKCADSSECFGWHQDCAYADLGPAHKLVTAWVALSDSSEDNGCVRMVSGARYPGLLAIIIVIGLSLLFIHIYKSTGSHQLGVLQHRAEQRTEERNLVLGQVWCW